MYTTSRCGGVAPGVSAAAASLPAVPTMSSSSGVPKTGTMIPPYCAACTSFTSASAGTVTRLVSDVSSTPTR